MEAVMPVVLPLQRLKVLKLIAPALVRRSPVPDFPPEFAVRIPIALFPNESAEGIEAERRVFLAGCGLAPNSFNGRSIKGLA